MSFRVGSLLNILINKEMISVVIEDIEITERTLIYCKNLVTRETFTLTSESLRQAYENGVNRELTAVF